MKKKIPWRFCIPPEVYTEQTGTKLGLFHTGGKVMLKTQLEVPIRHRKPKLSRDPVSLASTRYEWQKAA